MLKLPCFPDAIIEMLSDQPAHSSALSHPPDKFYNPGSTIFLKCIIRRHLIQNATIQDITNISWKKSKVLIDLQKQERIRKVLFFPSPFLCRIILSVWVWRCPARWWRALSLSPTPCCRILVITPALSHSLVIRTFLGPGHQFMSFMVSDFSNISALGIYYLV